MKITLDLPEKVERLMLSIASSENEDLEFIASKEVKPSDGQKISYLSLGLFGGEWEVRDAGKTPEYDAAYVRRKRRGE